MRHQVLPVIEEHLGPGVAEALARSARLLGEDADALDSWAALTSTTREIAEVSILAALPVAVRKRVLKLMAEAAGTRTLTAAHVEALDALVTAWHGQGSVALPGGVMGFRRTGRIGFGPLAARD